MVTREEAAVILWIPIGIALLMWLGEDEKKATATAVTGKEAYYLQYNKDEIFKNLLAAESHLKTVEDQPAGDNGFMNCVVKHLADAEQHSDEAISHSLVAANEEKSENFKYISSCLKETRHMIQAGQLSPAQAIVNVRSIRQSFEKSNPEFDISKCTACDVA